jgi:hypothetical protein
MKTGVQTSHGADIRGADGSTGLSAGQLEHFDEHGYLLVPGMLDPAADLDPILDEYDGVLDRLAHTLFAQGKVSSPYPDLPFGERISRMYEESGEMLNQWFDFHLPQRHVTHDTPFWVGPAVFGTLVNPKLLDAVESVIGGEIYSNPVQHVRIKPPEGRMGRQPDGRPVYGATVWHQDNGVIQADGDGSDILTVWFPITDALIQHGCLHVVPGSHRGGIYTHCPMEKGSNEVLIPDHLFPVERALPMPMRRGDVLFLHKRTCHGSLSNVSNEVRISFDLRYNPVGQRTGREVFPGFVARSRRNPASELRDPVAWAELWYATRRHMADANVDVSFNRWDPDAAGCA